MMRQPYRFFGFCLAVSALLLWPLAAAAAPALWKAERAGTVVWLFGSVHLGRSDFYPLPPAVEQAWNQADALLVEADITQTERIARVAQAMRLPVRQQLDDVLDARNRELMRELGDRLPLPASAIQLLRPWAASLAIASAAMQRWGYLAEQGVDLHFLQRAAERRLPVVELEGVVGQMLWLAALKPAESNALLRAVLAPLAEGRAEAEAAALVAAWQAGELKALSAALAGPEDDPAVAALNRRLMAERNPGMRDGILAEARPGRTLFVVVGVGHLIGPGSVLTLLERAGFTVTRSSA
jgi:hypothetical protein